MRLPIADIEPNTFNPNTMTPDIYSILRNDIKTNGLETIDPITVSTKSAFYGTKDRGFVIVDGEHRWQAVKDLGLPQIPARVLNMTEAEAKAVNYRKNKERGALDAYLEGTLFISENQAGLTQDEIAEKYGVSQAHVSLRMALAGFKPHLNKIVESIKTEMRTEIEQEEKELAEIDDHDLFNNKQYRENRVESMKTQLQDLEQTDITHVITPSHVEELLRLSTPQKKAEAIASVLETKSSVANTRKRVERLKREEDQEKQLKDALAKSKHTKCPVCKTEPDGTAYRGLPWVRCKGKDFTHHTWSLDSGLTEEQVAEQERQQYLKENPEEAKKEKSEVAKRFEPQSFRYPLSVDDIREKLAQRIIKMVSGFDSVEQIRVIGKRVRQDNGQEVVENIDLDLSNEDRTNMWYSEDVYTPGKSRWSRDHINQVHFNIEPKEWKTDSVNKVKVNCQTTDKDKIKAIRTFIDDL